MAGIQDLHRHGNKNKHDTKVWLGLLTVTTWLVSGRDCGFGKNKCYLKVKRTFIVMVTITHIWW